MKSKTNWTDADSNKLRDAREKAGFDLFTFARENSLSTAQLCELEQGGSSYFYTPTIKYSVGKKLLNSLGIKTDCEMSDETSQDQVNPVSSIKESVLEESTQLLQPSTRVAHFKSSKPILFAITLGALCIAVAFVYYPIFKTQSNVTPINATHQNVQLEKFNESNNQVSATQPITVAEPVVQNHKIELAANECIWSQNIPNLSAQNPSKDGNYVYLVATKEVVVCIKDNTNKVSIVNLKANETQNIVGVSPLTLQSKDLDSLNIFFQGSKVQLPSKNTTEVKLVAIPVQ